MGCAPGELIRTLFQVRRSGAYQSPGEEGMSMKLTAEFAAAAKTDELVCLTTPGPGVVA